MKNKPAFNFMLGALIGAGIAWLFNSKQGKAFIEEVKNSGADLKAQAEQNLDSLKQKIDKLKNDILI